MKITEREMRGLLTGKCLPGDMRLNEDLPAYLVRKFDELQQKLDAMAAENAALKDGPHGFFAYDSGCGYEEFQTAKEAQDFAETSLSEYRGEACGGWSDEVGSVVWGVIMQRATMTGLRPVEEGDNCAEGITEWCDYALLPNIETPATDAYLNSVRAEGAIAVRNALVLADDGSDIYAIATDTAEQLRSGTHDTADKAG
ncbi:hypothetical protein QMZ93_12290 [Pantoea stewartii subsp. indologenes]|uniref:hypothetical protein n=1 Tax=Pantoea stewartii TaxID=66269 RepID=UPI0019814A6E|nr:hypothetical protein [Pantoea stewartii]MDK2634111.1 hypothetical protein [Pantoea stewartii subsp. indologenes]